MDSLFTGAANGLVKTALQEAQIDLLEGELVSSTLDVALQDVLLEQHKTEATEGQEVKLLEEKVWNIRER